MVKKCNVIFSEEELYVFGPESNAGLCFDMEYKPGRRGINDI